MADGSFWSDQSLCDGCVHQGCCGFLMFDTSDMDEETIFYEHCCGCPCGDGLECNRDMCCSNYEDNLT